MSNICKIFACEKKNHSSTWAGMSKMDVFNLVRDICVDQFLAKIRKGWIKQFIQSPLYAMRRFEMN